MSPESMMPVNDDFLMELAAAVADGTSINWAEAESRAQSDEHRQLIRQLRALADLAGVHRSDSNPPLPDLSDSRMPAGADAARSLDSPMSLKDGRFIIEGRLGKGGYGLVYEAYDQQRKTRLALKSLSRSDVGSIYDLKNEFRALADLSHPNLVTLYDLFADGDHWFIAMEIVKGTDFLSYVRKRTPEDGEEDALSTSGRPGLACSLKRLASVTSQLADALCYLHGQGKLHRDIKPSNVLVTPNGVLKVLDFGLTTDVVPDVAGDTLRIRGTPAYISPEQTAGEAATEASDWYSVGVMLFEALTGQRPFVGTFVQVMEAKEHQDAPAPASLCDGVPERLDALCRDLLERQPAMRPSDTEVVSRLQRMWPPEVAAPVEAPPRPREQRPFVGREEQLAVLKRAFDASLHGRAQTVYVHGGSGMGKTALVRRFLQQLREREPSVVVLEGRCYERESVPYKAFDNLVDRLSRYLKRLPGVEAETLLPRDVSALTRLFPMLRRVDAIAMARQRTIHVTNAQELRRRGFAAFRELLGRLTDRHPVVLVIDDLQWGDTDSAALIADLIQAPEPPPLLFITCYRSEEAFSSAVLSTLLFANDVRTSSAEYDTHEVIVDQLTDAEAHELATALTRSYGATTSVGSIVRESGHSPFFIDELIQYSATVAGIGGPVVNGRLADSDASRELTLDSVIAARTSRVGEHALRLLQVVAVFGSPLKLSIASEAAELPAGALEEVTALRAAHLTRTRLGATYEEIEVYHDRIREAVVAQISPPVLRELNARLAAVLERSSATDPETLVVHFQGAGQNDSASTYAVMAADRAREALAFDRASRQYRLALDLGRFDDARRREIQIKLGDALAASGRGYEAAQAYLTAAEGALAAELLELKRRAAEQLLRSGHIDEGLKAIRAVLDALDMHLAESPGRALVSLFYRRAWLTVRGLRFRERDRSQLSAEELVRVDACWTVATAIGVVDTIVGADFQARHLLLALETGDLYRIARALAVEIAYTSLGGSRMLARQQKLTGMARQLAERVGQPETLALVMLASGTAAFFQGKWRTAHEFLERAEPMLRECSTSIAWELDTTYLYHLLSLAYLGEVKELSARLPRFLKEARERDDITAATNLRTRTAYIMQLANDNPEQAREEVRQGMARWAHQGFHAQHSWELHARGEIDLYAGRGLDAWNYVTARWKPLRRSLLLRIQAVRIEKLFLRARSALAAADDPSTTRDDRAALLRSARRDAKQLRHEGAAWASALAALILSGVATAHRDHGTAIKWLETAETAFENLDMHLHLEVARTRRGELIGGSDGALLVQGAERWMTLEGIRNPARMAAMIAPGSYTRR